MSQLEPSPLDRAAYDWQEAKQTEADARERRLDAERRIIELMGVKEEGAHAVDTDWYRIKTEGNLTRTLVEDFGAKIEPLPLDIQNSLIRWKPALDVRAFKTLATENPDAYRIACAAVVATPAKPTVKVELRKEAA